MKMLLSNFDTLLYLINNNIFKDIIILFLYIFSDKVTRVTGSSKWFLTEYFIGIILFFILLHIKITKLKYSLISYIVYSVIHVIILLDIIYRYLIFII